MMVERVLEITLCRVWVRRCTSPDCLVLVDPMSEVLLNDGRREAADESDGEEGDDDYDADGEGLAQQPPTDGEATRLCGVENAAHVRRQAGWQR